MGNVRDHRKERRSNGGEVPESPPPQGLPITVTTERGNPAAAEAEGAAAAVVITVPTRPGRPVLNMTTAWTQYRGDAQKTGMGWTSTQFPEGRVLWTRKVGPMIDSSPSVAPDGTIYVGTVDRTSTRSVVALNPDGTERWAVGLQAEGFKYRVRAAPAIRSDGRVVVVGYRYYPGRGRLFLLSPAGAIEQWSEEYNSPGLSSPALDEQDNTYYWSLPPRMPMPYGVFKFGRDLQNVTSVGATPSVIHGGNVEGFPWWLPPIFAFDPSGAVGPSDGGGGPEDWPLDVPLPSPALGGCRDVVATSYKTVRCWTEGHNLWVKDIRGVTTPAMGRSGRAYLPTGEFLEAWDQNGERRWQLNLVSRVIAPPALGIAPDQVDPNYVPSCEYTDSQGRRMVSRDHRQPHDIYVALANGYVCGIDYKGQLRWKTAWVSQVRPLGAPVCIQHSRTQEQRIVLGAADGALTAFNRFGMRQWQIRLDSAVLGTPAPVNARLYVATQSSVYAIA